MGLFRRFREKRKQKKKEEKILEEFLGEKSYEDAGLSGYSHIQGETEEYILGRLEKLLEEIKSMNEVKDEYYEVVDYVNDIRMIEELDEPEFSNLKRISEQLVGLGKTQEEYVNYQSKLSPEQFNGFRQSEEELDNLLRRMRDNEGFYNTLKRDMGYLEGEKTELAIKKDRLNRETRLLRRASTVLFSLFIVGCIIMFVLQYSNGQNIRIPFLIAAVSVAIIGVGIFIRMQMDQRELTRTEKNYNYAIELLNKVRLKYVNVKNALDYTSEKLGVGNSYELEFAMDEYYEMLKREQSFEQVKENITYYEDLFERKLAGFHLKNRKSWLLKPEIFVDETKMLLLKQELYKREEKLKKELKSRIQSIRASRDEMNRLLIRQPDVSKEIVDILDSIDDLLGDNKFQG